MIHIFFTNERWPWQHHWCVWHFPLQSLRMIAIRNVSPLSLHQIISVSCIYHLGLCIWKGNYIVRCTYIVYLCHRIHDKTIFNISPRRDTNSQVHVVPPLTVFGDVVQLRTDSSFSALHPAYTLHSRTELAGRRSLTSTYWMEKTNIWYLQIFKW